MLLIHRINSRTRNYNCGGTYFKINLNGPPHLIRAVVQSNFPFLQCHFQRLDEKFMRDVMYHSLISLQHLHLHAHGFYFDITCLGNTFAVCTTKKRSHQNVELIVLEMYIVTFCCAVVNSAIRVSISSNSKLPCVESTPLTYKVFFGQCCSFVGVTVW